MQCSGQGFRRHLHDTRERTIDDHDDEEPGENQSCQRSGHHGLSTKIVSRKKEPDYALPSVTKRLVAAWKFCGIS
jgi:hypothetical protein